MSDCPLCGAPRCWGREGQGCVSIVERAAQWLLDHPTPEQNAMAGRLAATDLDKDGLVLATARALGWNPNEELGLCERLSGVMLLDMPDDAPVLFFTRPEAGEAYCAAHGIEVANLRRAVLWREVL